MSDKSNGNTRVYTVTGPGKDEEYLIRAGTQAQAIRHVVRGKYGASVASQDDMERLMEKGVKVQKATAEDAE